MASASSSPLTPIPACEMAPPAQGGWPRFVESLKAYVGDIYRSYMTTLVGFHITGKTFFEKPYTLQYPEQSTQVPKQFRGIHEYNVLLCNACGACVKACPVDCIKIESIGKGKKARLTRYAIDYSKCLFCNLCTEACPSDAIWMGGQWNLARATRQGCWLEFSTVYPEAPPEPPDETKVPEVVADSQKPDASVPPAAQPPPPESMQPGANP